ncbi:MAG: cytochrome-c peroxidase, partial [Bacteroidota bacterium]|nr:cytochrome-c peroxidase [Bacteroidota bacterium]
HYVDSCGKNNSDGHTILKQEIPPGFPPPHYKFENNKLTKEGFELGRQLFYDGRLSKDGNFACASCHQQFAAFATYDHNFSHGFNNAFTIRNAPGLFNLAWQSEFQHDGGINHIEVQPLAPMTASNEMAESLDTVIAKLKQDTHYREMFKACFGDETINSQRILKALAQFTCSIISADSKYDRAKKGLIKLDAYEQRGEALFLSHCATCHPPPLFTDFSYRNIGLPVNTYLNDYGRMRITNNKDDSLKFKVPSLRNVNITFPYMHDGRFNSLRQCIEHYINGVQKGPTTDLLVVNKISLSRAQVTDLVQFLRALTDSTFIRDPGFAQPAF